MLSKMLLKECHIECLLLSVSLQEEQLKLSSKPVNTRQIKSLLFLVLNYHSLRARDLSATQITEVKELLKQLLESSQDSPNPDWTVERGIELLQIIIENERFLSYFALGVEARVGCLDRAILESLIKCSTMNPVDQCTTALKFGCIDVIKQQVIRDPSIRSALNDGKIIFLNEPFF